MVNEANLNNKCLSETSQMRLKRDFFGTWKGDDFLSLQAQATCSVISGMSVIYNTQGVSNYFTNYKKLHYIVMILKYIFFGYQRCLYRHFLVGKVKLYH